MKRKISFCRFPVFLLLLLLFLAGCQPTPEISPVVNRSEGIPDSAYIEPLEGEERKQVEAPAVWTEEIQKGEGRITILAEQVKPQIPEIQNTPVLEIQEKEFDQELLCRLTDYFTKGSLLYEVPAMTKEELIFWEERIQNRRGIYGYPSERAFLSSELTRIRELIEKAPEVSERNDVQPQFCEAVLSEYEYVRTGKPIDNTEPDTFEAVVQNNGALIWAERKQEQSGTSSSFAYRKGSYLDTGYLESAEETFERLLEQGDADEEWIKEYRIFLNTLRHEIESTDLKQRQEAVIKQAEEVLADLEITELTLADIRPCIVTEESLKWDSMNVDWSKAERGYAVEFARSCGSLTASLPGGAFYYYDALPEKTYSPELFPESVILVFAGQELRIFEWNHMAVLTKVVAENTKLLSFDEIKERFAQHLFYTAAAQDENAGRDVKVTETYVVSEVRLTAYYSEAYGSPGNAWVVPVWLFTYDYYRTINGEQRYVAKVNTMIQAIDGGYIQLMP